MQREERRGEKNKRKKKKEEMGPNKNMHSNTNI